MDSKIINKLKAKTSDCCINYQLLNDQLCYTFRHKDIEVFFAEFDLRYGDSLIDKEIVSFFIKKDKYRCTIIMSVEFLLDQTYDEILFEIESCFDH